MFIRDQLLHSTKGRPNSYVCGAMAGVADFLLFHPFDTAIRRMQNAQGHPRPGYRQLVPYYKQVIFNGRPAGSSLLSSLSSLYAGAFWAFLYKVTARGYKFGTQPLLEKALNDRYRPWMQQHVDQRCVGPLIKAGAASLIGVGECGFAPLDAIVVRYQGNETRPAWHIVRSEGMNLYRGAGWTAARNGIGSFFLFSIPAFVSAGITDKTGKTHTWQEGLSNLVGGVASTVATNPIDMIKTRIQSLNHPMRTSVLLQQMISEEGVAALFKGITIRALLVAPRLAIIKTIAEGVPAMWAYYANHQIPEQCVSPPRMSP